jgi:hypothetical protein
MSSNFPLRASVLPLLLVLAAMVCAVGCVNMETTARTRAANDLKCGEDAVVVQNIGGSSYRATGCGQEATYNCAQSTQHTFVCQREEQKAVVAGGQ